VPGRSEEAGTHRGQAHAVRRTAEGQHRQGDPGVGYARRRRLDPHELLRGRCGRPAANHVSAGPAVQAGLRVGNAQVLIAWAIAHPPASGTVPAQPAVSRPVLTTRACARTPPGGGLRRKLMVSEAVTASGVPVAPTTAA